MLGHCHPDRRTRSRHSSWYLCFRMMTYSYLWVFNLQSLACPSVLSYDWQLGSVPLLTSGLDPRLLLTILASLASLALLRTVATSHSRSLRDNERGGMTVIAHS